MLNQAQLLMVQQFKDVTLVSFQHVSVLDSNNIETMGQHLLDLVEKQNHRRLVLDFSAVKFMSSQAIGSMLKLKKAVDAVQGSLIIAAMRPELVQAFHITNLHKVFQFKDDVDKALRSLGVVLPK